MISLDCITNRINTQNGYLFILNGTLFSQIEILIIHNIYQDIIYYNYIYHIFANKYQ